MTGHQDFPPENIGKSQESNMIIIRANSLRAFSLSGQDRANHGPGSELAHCLSWRSPSTKNDFYMLKWLKKESKEYFMTWENYKKFKCQCLYVKLYGNTVTPMSLHIVSGCCCDATTEQPGHRLCGTQSHTMASLSGHFKKKFADPWIQIKLLCVCRRLSTLISFLCLTCLSFWDYLYIQWVKGKS